MDWENHFGCIACGRGNWPQPTRVQRLIFEVDSFSFVGHDGAYFGLPPRMDGCFSHFWSGSILDWFWVRIDRYPYGLFVWGLRIWTNTWCDAVGSSFSDRRQLVCAQLPHWISFSQDSKRLVRGLFGCHSHDRFGLHPGTSRRIAQFLGLEVGSYPFE